MKIIDKLNIQNLIHYLKECYLRIFDIIVDSLLNGLAETYNEWENQKSNLSKLNWLKIIESKIKRGNVLSFGEL